MRHPGRKLLQTYSPVFPLLFFIHVTIPITENRESLWGWDGSQMRALQEGDKEAFSTLSLRPDRVHLLSREHVLCCSGAGSPAEGTPRGWGESRPSTSNRSLA